MLCSDENLAAYDLDHQAKWCLRKGKFWINRLCHPTNNATSIPNAYKRYGQTLQNHKQWFMIIYLVTANSQELWVSRMKCAWLEIVSIRKQFMYALSTQRGWPNSCTVFTNGGDIFSTCIPTYCTNIFSMSLKFI